MSSAVLTNVVNGSAQINPVFLPPQVVPSSSTSVSLIQNKVQFTEAAPLTQTYTIQTIDTSSLAAAFANGYTAQLYLSGQIDGDSDAGKTSALFYLSDTLNGQPSLGFASFFSTYIPLDWLAPGNSVIPVFSFVPVTSMSGLALPSSLYVNVELQGTPNDLTNFNVAVNTCLNIQQANVTVTPTPPPP